MAKVESIIQKIEGRYNPEFDLIPDGPRVTWAEAELAEAIKVLLARIQVLEAALGIPEYNQARHARFEAAEQPPADGGDLSAGG